MGYILKAFRSCTSWWKNEVPFLSLRCPHKENTWDRIIYVGNKLTKGAKQSFLPFADSSLQMSLMLTGLGTCIFAPDVPKWLLPLYSLGFRGNFTIWRESLRLCIGVSSPSPRGERVPLSGPWVCYTCFYVKYQNLCSLVSLLNPVKFQQQSVKL